MRKKLVVGLGMCFCTGAALSPAAFAVNGYFLEGYGNSRAMGGASVAFPQDSMVSAANPAAITELETRVDMSAAFFRPIRHAYAPGLPLSTAPEVSGSNLFLIPSMGANFKFNKSLSFGMAAVGSGANTRYNRNFFSLSGGALSEPTLGVSLIQMIVSPTAAYKVSKNHSIGGSLLLGAQQFRAYGASDFNAISFSSDPDYVSNDGNDHSFGAGIRLGWFGKFMDNQLTMGVSGSSKVYMQKFNKYRGLFAEQGGFDIPPNAAIGMSYKLTDQLTTAFDISHIMYEEIASVSNKGPLDFNAPPAENQLGADNGFGFGWENVTAYKLGFHYQYDSEWILRAGWNYGKSPIQEDQLLFNIMAPATVEHHATGGFTYNLNKNVELSGAITHAFRHDQIGLDPATNDNIRIGMSITTLEGGIAYKF